jgi:hypothetical protein
VDTQRGSPTSQPFGRLGIEVLEDRVVPSIVLVNPAGNTPQGNGANNGEAIVAENPAGHAPPGHNK